MLWKKNLSSKLFQPPFSSFVIRHYFIWQLFWLLLKNWVIFSKSSGHPAPGPQQIQTFGAFFAVQSPSLVQNIRLAWKKLSPTNTLAYRRRRKKSFSTLAPVRPDLKKTLPRQSAHRRQCRVSAGCSRGKYHCTIDLLIDLFELACFANKNKKLSVVIQLIPNQSNRRSTVQ